MRNAHDGPGLFDRLRPSEVGSPPGGVTDPGGNDRVKPGEGSDYDRRTRSQSRVGFLPKERPSMAVGIRIKLHGITQEQFDKGHNQINPDRTPPKGLLYHASGPVDGGWGIIDFWESRERL